MSEWAFLTPRLVLAFAGGCFVGWCVCCAVQIILMARAEVAPGGARQGIDEVGN